VGLSLGILSLYGLWAAYGAAPSLLGRQDGHGDGHEDAGHGEAAEAGHGGHAAAPGEDEAAFRAEAEAFIARHRLPDGSVRPEAPAVPTMTMPGHGDHAGHGEPAAAGPAHDATAEEPIDVYLLVQQWLFEPEVLRLAAGVPYRLRMLATDVSHGASLQLGLASRIVRLRPGRPSELLVRFEQPGEYLLYCTVYCGPGHDRMFGRIIVS
jgi:heme/copper-type cytochrome/quinol oxidase subunit 2